MSRSYKKAPVSTDGRRKTTKYFKNVANRKVRRAEGLYQGKSYRKLYNSWNIHDYISYWTIQDAIKYFERTGNFREYQTLDEFLNEVWYACYKRK